MKAHFISIFFFITPVSHFCQQPDSISELRKAFEKMENGKRKCCGDTVFLANFYYHAGLALPMGSFAQRSNKMNYLGKSFEGINWKGGVELYINSKNMFSIDFDRMIFSTKNDSLRELVIKEVGEIYGPHDKYSGSVPGGFKIVVSNLGFGYSRIINFKRLSIQLKVVPSAGRVYYDFLASFGINDTTNSVTIIGNKYPTGPGNIVCSTFYYYSIRPEINFKYIFFNRNRFAFVLNAGASYFRIKPHISLMTQGFSSNVPPPESIGQINGKMSSINTYLGFNLLLKKKARPALLES